MIQSFELYILEIKKNNKSLFAANKIQMSPESFEKQLERAFNAGFRYCEELKVNCKPEKEIFGNIFEEMFGNKKK